MVQRLVVLALLLAHANLLFGQHFDLNMRVRDAATREPLVGATVRLPGVSLVGGTDSSGLLLFSAIPEGNWHLTADYLGYQHLEMEIHVPTDTLQLLMQAVGADLDEVVVESTRTSTRLENSPIKVEVLGQEDMEEENHLKPNNVASILGDYSGIQIQQTGVASGNASIRIQGLAGRYTQVLRDGLPFFTGLSGDFGILQIQPLDLQQIELIKGPASTFFGGGAIAGVVNFISKKPSSHPEKAISLNQTSLGESNFTGWSSGKNKRWGYTLFAGATHALPQDVDKDGFSDVPALKAVSLHPRLFYYPRKKGRSLSIGYSGMIDRRRSGYLSVLDHAPVRGSDYSQQNATRRSIVDLQYQQTDSLGAKWGVKAAWGSVNRRLSVPDWQFAGVENNWYLETTRHGNFLSQFRWVAGLNYLGNAFNKGATDSLHFGNFQYHTAGLFGQGAFHSGPIDAQLGFRLDVSRSWGWFPLPAAAVLYHASKDLSLRGSIGWGYLVPNPVAGMDFDRDFRRLGALPDNVQAERSAGGSLEWNYHKLLGDRMNVTWNQQFFYTRLAAPLIESADADGVVYWRNAAAPVSTKGVDHFLLLEWERLEWYLGYTFQDARQTWNPTQNLVPLSPRHRAAFVVSWNVGKHFRSGLESAWTGRQTLENGDKTRSFWFAAAMVGLRLGKFDLVFNGENLLDFRQTRYEKVVLPPNDRPTFQPLWAPVDGRVFNLALAWHG